MTYQFDMEAADPMGSAASAVADMRDDLDSMYAMITDSRRADRIFVLQCIENAAHELRVLEAVFKTETVEL